MSARIVLADDQELIRNGFRMILEQAGHEVVGDAADGLAAVEMAQALRPDVVLMDVRMPVMDGIEATRRLVERYATQPAAPNTDAAALDQLTGREREVLRLIAHGLSNSDIAQHLYIAESTVKTHVANVLMKLHLRDRVQAVEAAYETGLVHARPSA